MRQEWITNFTDLMGGAQEVSRFMLPFQEKRESASV